MGNLEGSSPSDPTSKIKEARDYWAFLVLLNLSLIQIDTIGALLNGKKLKNILCIYAFFRLMQTK